MAIGVPGWPELAACTASIDRVRMVLMHSRSRSGLSATAAFLREVDSIVEVYDRCSEATGQTMLGKYRGMR